MDPIVLPLPAALGEHISVILSPTDDGKTVTTIKPKTENGKQLLQDKTLVATIMAVVESSLSNTSD